MARVIPIPIGPIYMGGPCRGIVHVVEKGDTLYLLGKKYHVSVTQLMYANPFVNVYNLQIGDELCIPVSIQPRSMGEMPESFQQSEQGRQEFPENYQQPEQGRQRVPGNYQQQEFPENEWEQQEE